MKHRHLVSASIALGVVLSAFTSEAATGTCDSSPAATQACIDQIQNTVGVVVNDIFRDANNNDAWNLPLYGKLHNIWEGCTPYEVNPGCAGTSNAPYSCPVGGSYSCASLGGSFAAASAFVNALDHQWWQPCRLADPTLVDVGGGKLCPANWSCLADGNPSNYVPWEGLVFDLGGPSNKVAIFAQNDHGPQPCESLEYTVFLTDEPSPMLNQGIVLHPATDGVDPMKWNRAVLSKIYTQGFQVFRNPPAYNAACGDPPIDPATMLPPYFVEDDSFVQVFSLPCGITFRYAAIVAGNDGLDFDKCDYHSSEGEIDAVAGLTENGSGVCPDMDGDHYVDCNCPGHPPVCDCNDDDPMVHPGAPETCDPMSPDLNCDGMQGVPCAAGLTCNAGICITQCGGGENPYCPPGTKCTPTQNGKLCVPDNCGCKPGEICVNNACVDACKDVTCPGGQVCQDGNCIDPCASIQCPQGQQCQAGQCVSPCNCFAGDLGCNGGLVCDTGASNTCVPPPCKGVMCAAGESCDPNTGMCVSFCNANVHCPDGQKCVAPDGCVPLCQGVQCPTGFACDPKTGQCADVSCENITCFPPQTCVGGVCVAPDGGLGGGGGQGTGGKGGGVSSSSSSSGSGMSSSGADPGSQGKCGCRVVGEPEDGTLPIAGALGLLGLAAAGLRRRRR